MPVASELVVVEVCEVVVSTVVVVESLVSAVERLVGLESKDELASTDRSDSVLVSVSKLYDRPDVVEELTTELGVESIPELVPIVFLAFVVVGVAVVVGSKVEGGSFDVPKSFVDSASVGRFSRFEAQELSRDVSGKSVTGVEISNIEDV